MNRFIRWSFEIFGHFLIIGLILIILGLGALALRLEQGPISFNDSIDEAEAFLRDLSPGYDFKIGNVQIEADPQYRAVHVRLSSVTVMNNEHRNVGALKDMILGYNWRNVLGMSVMPVSIEIVRPTVDITRFENGHLGFNLQEEQAIDEPTKSDVSVDEVIAFLKRAPHALRHIRIRDAHIRYHNLQRNYHLNAENGLFDFHRIRGDIHGTMALDVSATEFKHRIQGSIAYDDQNDYTDVSIGITDVLLDHLRVLTPDIPEALEFDVPMSALVTASIDRSLQWQKADIVLTGKKGNLMFAPYFDGTIRVSDLALSGTYEPLAHRFTLNNFVTKIGESALSAKAKVDFSKPDLAIQASAQVHKVPVDKLSLYWPQGLGTNARDWVTQFIQDGTADSANIDVAVIIPEDKTQDPVVEKLQGGIAFTDLTVDYLTPMPPAKHVNGTATFDTENFDIKASGGKLFDTTVNTGDIRISKLLTEDPEIAIALDIEGPIRDAIATISYEPLEYAQRMGMKAEQFTGTSRISLNLAFPLLTDLELEQVEMTAISSLQDVTIRNVLKDLTVVAKELDLTVNTEQMLVTGDARINQAPAKIEWQEFFTDDAEYTTIIKADGKVTPAVLSGLRLPISRYFNGASNAQVTLRQDAAKNIQVDVTSELAGLGISVPEFGLAKQASAAGKASLSVAVQPDGVTTISDGAVSWPNVSIANAMVRFDKSQELESATLKNIRADRTRADIIIAPDGRGGSRIVIKGDVVDASAFWSYKSPDADKTPQAQNKSRTNLSVRANTLYLDYDHPFQNVKADILLQGYDLRNANISGTTGKNARFSLVQVEHKDATRRLTLQSNDTGSVLRALDMMDDVHGGVLDIQGQSLPTKPAEINGFASLTDFTVVKAPVLARILNAFSPGGIINLLNNNGLVFAKMQSEFSMSDIQTIRLKKGKMAGTSLGLSFSGTIHRDTQSLNLKGTIVPLDGINKFFGRIPVIGQILTGVNGDGLIGATYTVKGKSDDPNVSVNPLSALTPGIFRSILFE